MKKNLTLLLAIFLLFQFNKAKAESFTSSIRINNETPILKIENRKLLFGNFFEFLNDFINGENGLWAQELYDRGFDDSKSNSLPPKWGLITHSLENAVIVKPGGYNENGVNSISIYNPKAGESGIQQYVYIEPKVTHEFYIYLKNNHSESSNFKLKVVNRNDNFVLYEKSLEVVQSEWQKYSFEIPALGAAQDVIVQLMLTGIGSIELDEVSIMPANNISGVRKEFYDLFREWKPGIIRYPGGYFADTEFAHFRNAIGAIDKRKSPMNDGVGNYQRMDFGVNEFIKFCKSIEAEPHIVVNLLNGTETEAANYVEYCNGSTNSIFGALRANDGYSEPYNVNYWEIGNEQWTDKEWMIPRYNMYANAMLEKDSDLRLIINGDVWVGKSYFDDCMSRTIGKCENYGWHYLTYALPKNDNYIDEERYKIAIGTMDEMYSHIVEYENWLIEGNYFPKAKQSITEHLIKYRIAPGWIDTNYMNASLEAGLLESGFLMNFLNSSKTFELYEKTFGLGHILVGRNSKNERIVYPTVLHNVLSFMRNHTGDNVFPLNIITPKYNTALLDGMFQLFDVPLINSSMTSDSNATYFYVLNKSYKDTLRLELDTQLTSMIETAKIYDLTAASNKVFHTPDNPNFIDFNKVELSDDNRLIIPPFTTRCFIINKTNDVPNLSDLVNVYTFNGKLFISLRNKQFNQLNCTLFSILGTELESFEFNNNNSAQYNMDINNYQSGLYLLRIVLDGSIIYKKIII